VRGALVAVSAAVFVAGCTGTSPEPAPTASSVAAPTSSAGPIRLTCADAASGSAPVGPGNVSVAGLTLEDLARPVSSLPRAGDTGATAPSGDQRIRKVPAYLPAGSPPVTVELLDPAPGQALVWVPAGRWSGRPDLRPWASTEVTLAGCPGTDATYLGGILADEPDACLHLNVQRAGDQPQTIRIRLDGHPC
jgi:hypothetical protein